MSGKTKERAAIQREADEIEAFRRGYSVVEGNFSPLLRIMGIAEALSRAEVKSCKAPSRDTEQNLPYCQGVQQAMKDYRGV